MEINQGGERERTHLRQCKIHQPAIEAAGNAQIEPQLAELLLV